MDINYWVLLPEMILALTGVAVMLAAPSAGKDSAGRLGTLALSGIALAFLAVCLHWEFTGGGYYDMVFGDHFASFAKLLFLLATGAVTVLSIHFLDSEKIHFNEFFAVLLFAAIGMCLMAASSDLIMTFIGIEVLSISTYILAGFRNDARSAESAWKYFILGAFSTAFLLYGVAFVYGATGSTKYLAIAEAIRSGGPSMALILGLGLIVVGFGFKAALAPFHVWTPDVYEGAPTPITAFLAVASKAAAFVALLRLMIQVFPDLSVTWQTLFWIGAVATMAIGNIAALAQTNIKRMLAYSSIAHAGYLLVGVTANSGIGQQAVLYYLTGYAFMTLGAFAVIQILGAGRERFVNLEDYAGIGFRHPFLSGSLSVFLVSMAGIPATAGFMGKLFLFSAAIESDMYWLVILGLIASAIGVYYYLRVIVLMFMREPGEDSGAIPLPLAARVTIAVMVAGTFYLGLFPGSVLALVSDARIF